MGIIPLVVVVIRNRKENGLYSITPLLSSRRMVGEFMESEKLCGKKREKNT